MRLALIYHLHVTAGEAGPQGSQATRLARPVPSVLSLPWKPSVYSTVLQWATRAWWSSGLNDFTSAVSSNDISQPL